MVVHLTCNEKVASSNLVGGFMQIQCFENEFPYIIIDDYYNNDELTLIWEEINFLKNKLVSSLEPISNSPKDFYGNNLKHNSLAYLDNTYINRGVSNILRINEKFIINDFEILRNHQHWFFKNVKPNIYYTSLSYYKDNDYYLPHWDECTVSSLTWLYKEPKAFTGGDLNFPDYDLTVKIKNNKTIIFPSCIKHQVFPVKMNDTIDNTGRYCISQFFVCSMNI